MTSKQKKSVALYIGVFALIIVALFIIKRKIGK